ncbi:RNA polymerase sigma factor [Rheinheimera sp. 4Y26]|uniref:RNA polymerase sigma factor n=1 Tax=Rheinheimera sp. 4Y26 TaxID=2977811 RepID=UPI0021B0E1D1|nr:sigma-70 family RNA polymerase sigma factor [Rheinheimera sp. 4Y26]MCT6700036.1 sigma-70 family RNA polymerase sigma factor [Rheinheimera sp. 4Y26]
MGWKQISIRLSGFTQAAPAQADSRHDELGWLFRSHADALYHFLLKQSDAELAQDISQQSWLKVLELQSSQVEPAELAAKRGDTNNHRAADNRTSPCFGQRSQFKTWLFTLARNALFDELRRRQRWSGPELSEETMLDTHASQLDVLVAAERQQALQQAIAVLPLLQKEALLLQLEGFSLEEIASISGSAAETVKSRLRYARASLSQALEHYHDL